MDDLEIHRKYKKIKTLIMDEEYYSEVLNVLNNEGPSVYLISSHGTQIRLNELLVDKDSICDKARELLNRTISECAKLIN